MWQNLSKYLESARRWFLQSKKNSRIRRLLPTGVLITILVFVFLFVLERSLVSKYNELESVLIKDRHGETISTLPNSKDGYSNYVNEFPDKFKWLLVKKEDRFFYLHLGINPISIARATLNYITRGDPGGSSTITQQLTKNLLGNENERTLSNKIIELAYTLGLEIFKTKESILSMYANTVYMGNNIYGFNQASIDYFGKNLPELSKSEFISLLASLSNPSTQNPWKRANKEVSKALADRLGVIFNPHISINSAPDAYIHKSAASFEFDSLKQLCKNTCTTTLDKNLTEKLRGILERNIYQAWDSGARNGAIVVIKEPGNELLAIVGSPNPAGESSGHSINMAIEPRPIGSTAKPFIYLTAFEKGLRPYTLVEDREYKYPIATGYPLYPKNYDGLYHGTVTLHESLSNSYNVPTVKTLEYVGLQDFYDFLQNRLAFTPLVDLDSYQFGIALGGLEMDPMTLAYYFSIFPNKGSLKPLVLFLDRENGKVTTLPPMSRLVSEIEVTKSKYTELVTKVLNDRKTGVEQFGLESSLNLTQDNYAVKTGTSQDYHDSWTVGFTPDYIVAVWLGNAENKPLRHVTGQSGAGQIWNEVMELLTNSEYNRKTPFAFNSIKAFLVEGNIDYGLLGDNVGDHRNLLEEKSLIFSPHEGDTVLLEQTTTIPLRSHHEVSWYANDIYLGTGTEAEFVPKDPATYRIRATDGEKTETISISVRRN